MFPKPSSCAGTNSGENGIGVGMSMPRNKKTGSVPTARFADHTRGGCWGARPIKPNEHAPIPTQILRCIAHINTYADARFGSKATTRPGGVRQCPEKAFDFRNAEPSGHICVLIACPMLQRRLPWPSTIEWPTISKPRPIHYCHYWQSETRIMLLRFV